MLDCSLIILEILFLAMLIALIFAEYVMSHFHFTPAQVWWHASSSFHAPVTHIGGLVTADTRSSSKRFTMASPLSLQSLWNCVTGTATKYSCMQPFTAASCLTRASCCASSASGCAEHSRPIAHTSSN